MKERAYAIYEISYSAPFRAKLASRVEHLINTSLINVRMRSDERNTAKVLSGLNDAQLADIGNKRFDISSNITNITHASFSQTKNRKPPPFMGVFLWKRSATRNAIRT